MDKVVRPDSFASDRFESNDGYGVGLEEVERLESLFAEATRCVCTDEYGVPLKISGDVAERYEAVKFHTDLLGLG